MTHSASLSASEGAVIVVVPSRRAAAQEADRSAAETSPPPGLSSTAVLTHATLTLRELVDRGASALPSLRPVLRGASFQLFVAEMLEELGPRGRAAFGPGTDATGAARSIAAAVAELRMAGVSAAALDQIAGRARTGARRLTALAGLLGRYEARLEERGRWDAARLHREVTALVRRDEWPPGLNRLEVRGLHEVTPLQAELLIELARRARSTRVEAPFDPYDEEGTVFALPYVKRWEELDDPGLDIEIAFPQPWDDRPGVDVRVAAAADPMEEARLAAEWVRARADEGCPLEGIGIVLPGARRLSPLARELGRRRVPFFARRSTPLAETPLFAALLLPFRLLEEGFRRADLLAWVTSPLTTRLDPDCLRGALMRGPAGAGAISEWNRALAAARGAAGALMTAALRDLDRLGRQEMEPDRFWRDYTAVLSRVGLDPAATAAPIAAWTAWDQVLAELREALEATGRWDGPACGWRTHRRHLATALGDRRLSEGRAGRGVSILTPQDARGLRFRHVAVLGLVQGSLVPPRPAVAVLGDYERAALNDELGRRLFRLAAEHAREGSLVLRECLRGSVERVLLCYPTADEDGNPLLPAIELETLRRKWRLESEDPHVPDPPWRLARSAEEIAPLQRLERDRASVFALPPERRRERASRFDGAFDRRSTAELARELEAGGALALWSAGRLESWRQCPHQFFQRYVLALSPSEERPLEAEPAVVGRVVHLALQDLHGSGGSELPDRNRIETALAAAAAHPEIQPLDLGDPLLWEATLRRTSAVLVRYFDHLREKHPSDAYRVIERELAFGSTGALPAIPVATAVGRVGLRGRIDRIDWDPETRRLRVVDYKYSKAERHRPAVDPERCGLSRFQLYVYLLAARAWSELSAPAPPSEIAAVVHCLREPSVLKPLAFPGTEAIERAIAAVVEEAAAGVFEASPREPDDCRLCDFRRSCRIATVAGPLPAGAEEDER